MVAFELWHLCLILASSIHLSSVRDHFHLVSSSVMILSFECINNSIYVSYSFCGANNPGRDHR